MTEICFIPSENSNEICFIVQHVSDELHTHLAVQLVSNISKKPIGKRRKKIRKDLYVNALHRLHRATTIIERFLLFLQNFFFWCDDIPLNTKLCCAYSSISKYTLTSIV